MEFRCRETGVRGSGQRSAGSRFLAVTSAVVLVPPDLARDKFLFSIQQKSSDCPLRRGARCVRTYRNTVCGCDSHFPIRRCRRARSDHDARLVLFCNMQDCRSQRCSASRARRSSECVSAGGRKSGFVFKRFSTIRVRVYRIAESPVMGPSQRSM